MQKYIMVEGSDSFARDMETGAIININSSEIETARKAKQNRIQKKQEFENLKNEVSEIKELLVQLLEKQNGN
jgi:hypothetical protein